MALLPTSIAANVVGMLVQFTESLEEFAALNSAEESHLSYAHISAWLRFSESREIWGQTHSQALRRNGSRIENCDPAPSLLETVIDPPWLSTACFTMESPNPVPPDSRVLALFTR